MSPVEKNYADTVFPSNMDKKNQVYNKKIDELQKQNIMVQEILTIMASHQQQMDENQKLTENRLSAIEERVKEIGRKNQPREIETVSKICIIVSGIVIVGFLITGFAVGYYRLTHT